MKPQRYLRQQTPEMRRLPFEEATSYFDWLLAAAIVIGIIAGVTI